MVTEFRAGLGSFVFGRGAGVPDEEMGCELCLLEEGRIESSDLT